MTIASRVRSEGVGAMFSRVGSVPGTPGKGGFLRLILIFWFKRMEDYMIEIAPCRIGGRIPA